MSVAPGARRASARTTFTGRLERTSLPTNSTTNASGVDAPSPTRGDADVGLLVRRGRRRERLVVHRVRHLEDAVVGHAVPSQVVA